LRILICQGVDGIDRQTTDLTERNDRWVGNGKPMTGSSCFDANLAKKEENFLQEKIKAKDVIKWQNFRTKEDRSHIVPNPNWVMHNSRD
jgi:hypothetical protein